jgi:hypothetical protein
MKCDPVVFHFSSQNRSLTCTQGLAGLYKGISELTRSVPSLKAIEITLAKCPLPLAASPISFYIGALSLPTLTTPA